LIPDKMYPTVCAVKLAKILGVAPDDLDVRPVLEMAELSVFQGSGDDKTAKLIPETKEQEDSIINQYYGEVVTRLFAGSYPFEGFMESVMFARGII